MDALTTGAIVLTVCAAVAFLLYKLWNKDEDTFAKARANKQITLLDDVTTAPKKKTDDRREKEKQQKKKEEKKKKAAASVDSKEDKPAAAPAAAVPEESPKPAAPAAAAPKKETPAKKEQPKPEAAEPKKKDSPAPETVAVKKEEATPLQQSASPSHEQKKSAQSNGEKKASKKPAAPKQVEEIENEEEFVEAKNKKAKKTEKKEAAPASESTAPRHLSLKDLDTNKLVTRLSSIDEIEVEYIEYLNNFIRDTALNASKAVTDAARVQRQVEEHARAIAAAKNEKTKLEGELESNRRLTHELAQKAAAAGSVEQELKTKLAAVAPEMDKLRRDLEASRKAAAAVVIPVVPDNKEELEKLRADAKSASARLAELEEQLRNAKESAAKERKQHEQSVLLQKTREDAAVGQEVLLAESRQNAKAISQRLTELEQVKEQLEKQVAEANKQADEAREEAKKREATHAADTQSLKTMIDELNKEVHRFEEAKKEQAEMVAKLAAKEAELVKKSAALEAAEKQIHAFKTGTDAAHDLAQAEINALSARVAELESALAEEQRRAAEIVIPVAEPKKEADVEEVVELKKSAYLNAAPPAAADNSEELAALKQENEELKKEQAKLQEKNAELRTSRQALNDQLTAMEKRVVANGVGPAPSTSAAAAAPTAAAAEEKGSKKSKKGGEKKEAAAAKEEKKGDEEERVRAERRLVQAHIAKLVGGATPALDDAADAKAYEQWLKSVGASIKEQQEKAKKEKKEAEDKAKKSQKAAAAPAPVVDDDAEKEQLRAENEKFREAFATLEDELQTIEQLKTEREETYLRRIAELEKTHGKAQIAEVRLAMDALPALTVPAAAAAAAPAAAPAARPTAASRSPPTSQSEDDGSWEVVA